ncbi:MAG: hypothetical protein A3A65_03090 [Candidatus Chisholmbacteria bacterium RIFCSPLOWO2_01_FULL_49_14]|uniref:Glycosyl transferase family 1 domain-containing protein n=1 Tax=Candidatus Chisholmbacteria bacterium RIFCSPLOWO2_01_FULL_49_14 TaxID=1797593 RepID=A0A1G1W2Y8_9BACT|nr:MAG: hypothetical protein A3A65_03090 [Candidatus Chisholmbacteria bacterium RIFCSPLOWO2_01_FULL_49_14]
MRIGIDGNEANIKLRVGSNVYAFELLRALQKISSKHQVTVYLKADPQSDMPPASQTWRYKVITPTGLWTRWRLPLELYSARPRENVFFTPGHYAPKFCPMPLAVSIMDLSFLHYPDMFRAKDRYTLTRWTKDSIKRANHIFTISQFSKDDIIKNYQIPEKYISVTYPGWSRETFERQITKGQIRRVKHIYNIQGDYILYLGTLQPRKNLVRLISAFAKLNRKDLGLVIAGKKGWQYAKILEEGKRLGIETRVRFIGFLEEEDKPAIMSGAKALMNVSLYEGFGMPVLEAMALGVPTVISQASSLKELAKGIGITVDPTDVKSISGGISRVLQYTEDQRNEIAVKSKSRAQKFSWELAAAKTLEVLNDIAV